MKANTKNVAIVILTVLTIFSATAFAQPSGQGMNRMMSGTGQGGQGMSPFIEPIFMGHGFALAGEEYHILHVNVIRMKIVSPGYVFSLLKEYNTPVEIAQKISSVERYTEIKAHLKFAGVPYALNITSYDNKSLSGDILTLPQPGAFQKDFIPAVTGHISLITSNYEAELLSDGILTLEGKEYKVLMTSPMRSGKGMGRWV
ncbi:MAG: hypothetical protein Q8M95_14740 [Candidatus Methanoperedens sp.]|nr:hypothetical protein [Candidatus Methanoperedens sp.]